MRRRPRILAPAIMCPMKYSSIQQRKTVAGVSLALMTGVIGLGFASSDAMSGTASADEPAMQAASSVPADASSDPAAVRPAVDRTGHKRYGKASFYAARFGGRKMANGQRFSLAGNNAASRTLPLGTTAKVTNLETGKSAVVVILDRGPYVGGRIVDLSPATASKIGITTEKGLAHVEVAPIAVPMPDGRIKLGAAASDPQIAENFLRPERRPSETTTSGG